MRTPLLLFSFALLALLLISSASAAPPLPAEFYGSVSIDGKAAPSGTTIIAKINGQQRGSITTSSSGVYGSGTGAFSERLVVVATEEDLAKGTPTVEFTIAGKAAIQKVPFQPGIATNLDLSTGGSPVTTKPTTTAPTTKPTTKPTGQPTGTAVSTLLPSLPHSFYGTVIAYGKPVSTDGIVEARVYGRAISGPNNPVYVMGDSRFGGSGALDQKLIVQGGISDGAPVEFWVTDKNYLRAAKARVKSVQEASGWMNSYPYQSGKTTELVIEVTTSSSGSGTGGGGGGSSGDGGSDNQYDTYINPNPKPTATAYAARTTAPTVPVGSGMIPLSANGTVLNPVDIVSEDGIASVSLATGVQPVDASGKPLDNIRVVRVNQADVPSAGPTFTFSGIAYDFKPDGASFSPGATIRFLIPQDKWGSVSQQEIKAKWYNPTSKSWEDVPAAVDPTARTVTMTVSHFSMYGLFNPVPTPTPEPVVIRTPTPTPTPAGLPIIGALPFYLLLLLIVIIVVVVIVVILIIYLMKRRGGGEDVDENEGEEETADIEQPEEGASLDDLDLDEDDLKI